MKSVLSWALAALTLVGCRSAAREVPEAGQGAPVANPGPSGGAVQPLVLQSIAPDSLRLDSSRISEVVLRGSGFDPSDNTVRVGPITLRQVPARNTGTEIRVVVPARYTTNAEAPPRPLFPGSYAVSVERRGATSNSVMLKVLP